MPEVDPSNVRAFASAADFEVWLGAHHARARELWLCIHKRSSGLASVTYAEALDVALAWGWIDGVKKSLDERSFLQRFTPRRPRSSWSQRNREHVERLQRAGRMRPPGIAEVEAAKADGRWAAAYAPPSQAQIPPQLLAAIEAVPAARATLSRLDAVNRFALAHRFGKLKTEAGRQRAIERYVQLLARGQTLHPMAGSVTDVAEQAPSPAQPERPAPGRGNAAAGATRAKSAKAAPSRPARSARSEGPTLPAKRRAGPSKTAAKGNSSAPRARRT